jgi:uncharacterized protein YidB (DUF937 family)
MKKAIFIGAILVVTLAALGAASYAFARTVAPPWPNSPDGYGRMGRRGGMGSWRGSPEGHGPMHEYMEDAIAEALGIDHEELEDLLGQGKTLWQIAEEKGFSQEQFRDLMDKSHDKALEKMVEDGVITEEQAKWMESRMDFMWERMWENDGDFGGCPGMGGFGSQGRGPGFRWNNPPDQSSPSSPSF